MSPLETYGSIMYRLPNLRTFFLVGPLCCCALTAPGQVSYSPVPEAASLRAQPQVSSSAAKRGGPVRSKTPAPPFELKDGDRVVLLGDALIEREQKHSYIETRIHSRYPDYDLVFRNLGWSGDNPEGQSRVSFAWNKPKEEWLKRIVDQTMSIKPTVVILGYGMANSFDGEAGIPKFKADLKRLIGAIRQRSEGEQIRFILLSPIRHESLPPPLPDPAKHNVHLALYTEAIGEIAEDGGHRFISLFDSFATTNSSPASEPITDNGIHLNALGYWRVSEFIEIGLGWNPATWRLGILADGNLRESNQFLEVENLRRKDNEVTFTGRPHQVEVPAPPGNDSEVSRRTPSNILEVEGLNSGTYVLQIDGETVARASDQDWNRGQVVSGGPPQERTQELRRAIIKKNELFFYRWRPANETYLFGFRRHEQGRNAREIPMFDPLIAEQEAKIAELKKPLKYHYRLALRGSQDSNSTPSTSDVSDTRFQKAGVGSVSDASIESGARPTSPAQTLPAFEIADGFEITLFAENPQLAKPIQINFDPQGRLWVASSSVYPQIEPGQAANDKILILEDTNGDGKADKSTVFADGLLIPTGIEPGDGGAYVGQSTELLHLKDTDGDGLADLKRVVLSGFGTEDTHHILHTLRWAPDGQLYFNQSIYIHSHLETPHGVVRLNSGGILHLRPPTMELGVFLRGFVNAWGHDVDEFGQSFVTDGAYFAGLNYGLPGAMYVTYAGARKILDSISGGGYPKFCALELIRSRHFPDDWQGNAITCDFRAHRIVRFSISEQGAGYVTREMPDLLRSSDVTFRPIDVKLGPDGALYIADWSNPIIQHGEVDFRDPRRDHTHGRIWRVASRSRPLVPKPALVQAETTDLLNQLLSPNVYNQRQASRVLTERGAGILPELASWTRAQTSENAKLRALWMYQAVDVVELNLLKNLLSATDGRVRAAAVRVLRFWRGRLNEPISLLETAIADEHPRVRLEAMRTLGQIQTARSAELVLSVLDKPMDRFLDYGLWLSINELANPWIESIQNGDWEIQGRERQLEFGLQSVEPALAGPVIRRLIESRGIPKDGSGPWIELVGKAGTSKELRQLYDQVLRREFELGAMVKALESIESAARLRKVKPSDDLGSVSELLSESDESLRAAAVRLAGVWRLRELTPKLLDMVRDPTVTDSVRRFTFGALREIGGADVVNGLTPLIGKDNPEALRLEGAQTLVSLNLKKGVPLAVELLSDLRDEAAALELWRSLLRNKGAIPAFADALRGNDLSAPVAKVGMRAVREGGRNAPELILALARSGNLEEEAHQLNPDETSAMIAEINAKGNPGRGEMIFRQPDLACVTCHSIGGVGGKVGPDLTSIGTSAQVDYLIESLLYPNRKVKEGYHSLVVETKDGLEYSGVPVRETSEELIVRDAADRQVSIPKDNIVIQTIGGSIMPSGLIDALEVGQQIDLYRFLSELGKSGPFDASRGNVARLWKLFPRTIDAAQFGDERVLTDSLTGRQWSTAFTLVDGRLPKAVFDSALASIAHREPSGIYAAAEFQTADSGEVALDISEVENLVVWINGELVSGEQDWKVELPAGTHRIVAKLDAAKLPPYFRASVSNGTFVTE